MTIQNILDAIAEALFQTFGSSFRIYPEKVEQNLVTPAFLVRCLNPAKNRHFWRRFLRTNQFSIQYITDSDEAVQECYSVMEQLFDCLADITVSGKTVHGTNLQGEVSDGILTFTVNYDGFVLKSEEEYIMETLEIEMDSKE